MFTKPSTRIIALALGCALFLNLFALVGWNRLNLLPDTAYTWMDATRLRPHSWRLLDLPVRWDSGWYLDIIHRGYVVNGPTAMSNIVFYPLYPFLIRLITLSFFSPIIVGYTLNLVFLVIGCLTLARLVREFHPDVDAEEAVFFALIFPTAIFFTSLYTESLFFCLSVLTIYFSRRHLWLTASVFGALAALTRITGALLFIPLVWEFIALWKERGSRRHWREALPLVLVPLAALSFFGFHALRFGDPFLFFKIESVWGRSFHLNVDHFVLTTSAAQANTLLDVSFVLLGFLTVPLIAKRLRPSYAAYTLASILVPLSSGTLMSIGRYILVLFPIPLLAATFAPLTKRYWTLASVLLLGLYATLYAHGYWAG